MPRRKADPAVGNPSPHVPPILDWETATRMTVNGRQVEPGTELSISGEPGRFRFIRHVRRPSGIEWVDVIGTDRKGDATGWRSFRPDRIKTVHRINRTRANAA